VGIILGQKSIVDAIKRNPLTRALRIDKMTLAALESTLRLYRDPEEALETIPTLRMLALSVKSIEKKAQRLASMLNELNDTRLKIAVLDGSSRAGGGSLPLQMLPSKCVGVKIDEISASRIERSMRSHSPPIIGRIEENWFLMDLRTIQPEELSVINSAFADLLGRTGP
jgi:L-seryl-tRNA(Ser) seleniumtransferase